jgi:hypothetical protein
VQQVKRLREKVDEVVINMGNHDCLREGHAYFAFLNAIPGVQFVTKPTELMMDNGPSAYMLPHTRTPAQTWAGMDFSHYDFLFLHQTVKGAVSSNGQEMDGEALPALNAGKVYSGDIHVPQICGAVEYVGSPYHVHFGDRFKPRCVLLDRRRRAVDLHFKTISRVALTVSSLEELRAAELQRGDHVKVKLVLSEAEAHEWAAKRRAIADYLRRQEVEVHGLKLEVSKSMRRRMAVAGAPPQFSPKSSVVDFVLNNGLGAEAGDLGLEFVK